MRGYDFTAGYCLAFAKALRSALGRGARIVDVVEPEDEAAAASQHPWLYPGKPHHVVVEFHGRYYDADGDYSADELLARWAQRAVDNHYPLSQPFRLEPHDAKRARDVGLKSPRDAVLAAGPEARAIAARVGKGRRQ